MGTDDDISVTSFDEQAENEHYSLIKISVAYNLRYMNTKPSYINEEAGRLKAIYKARKAENPSLNQEKVADDCGWSSQSVVSQYMTGKIPLNLSALISLSRSLRFTPESVSTRLAQQMAGLEQPAFSVKENGGAYAVEANAELIGMLSGWDNETPLHDDEVAIPLYKEVELAAGGGTTEVTEVPGRLIRFAKSTLREAGVQECNAACATLRGRSMERLIMDGATVGIDRGTTYIDDGEIYAFDHDGMLRVKYLYRLPGGSVRIRSENDEEFPDEVVTAEEFSHIRMLGWVFWWSTVRRRRDGKLAK